LYSSIKAKIREPKRIKSHPLVVSASLDVAEPNETDEPPNMKNIAGRPTRVNNNFKTATPIRDDETIAQVNFITHTATTLIEEGAKRLFPSSSEISHPAEQQSTYLDVAHANIKPHHKPCRTAPQTM